MKAPAAMPSSYRQDKRHGISYDVDSNNCTDLRSPANKIPFISKSFFSAQRYDKSSKNKNKTREGEALYMLVILRFCNLLIVNMV